MAIKIAGNIIISDTRELENITAVDALTANTINYAIVNQTSTVGSRLDIIDSAGTTIKRLYAASDGTV
jgi:hypothetical protein